MKHKIFLSGCYNEDDFVQRGENLDELTVTITLCEYRNNIIELVRFEKNLEIANDKIAKLEKENSDLAAALAACKMPEWIKAIGRVLSGEPVQDDESGDDSEPDSPGCKWNYDEICVNDECPYCGDYCPVDVPGVCKFEDRSGSEVTENEG